MEDRSHRSEETADWTDQRTRMTPTRIAGWAFSMVGISVGVAGLLVRAHVLGEDGFPEQQQFIYILLRIGLGVVLLAVGFFALWPRLGLVLARRRARFVTSNSADALVVTAARLGGIRTVASLSYRLTGTVALAVDGSGVRVWSGAFRYAAGETLARDSIREVSLQVGGGAPRVAVSDGSQSILLSFRLVTSVSVRAGPALRRPRRLWNK